MDDIDDVFENTDDLILHYNGDDESQSHNVTYTMEDIDIVENIVPYRRPSRFDCMFHVDEGYVNGTWAKGETTARNEKRFVTEMQQGLIKYKEDGMNNIMDVLEIDNIDDTLYPNTKFINVRMK